MLGMESRRRRSFQTVGNPLTGRSMVSFGISEDNITRREKRKEKKNPQKTCLTATASREVAQMLMSAISEKGLNREAQAA